MKNHKIINRNIKIVNLEFLNKKRGLAIRICKLINLLTKADDFIKMINSLSNFEDFIKMINSLSKTDDFIKNDKYI